MATNQMRFIRNDITGSTTEFRVPGLFQAGTTQAIKSGELLELTNTSSTKWVPIDSDFAMVAQLAIAGEEVKDGDRAGYYWLIVPRPGDVFEFDLAAASAITVTTPLYYSSSEALTVSAGTNIIARAVGFEHYPLMQGHLADDASGDSGTTVKSTSKVLCSFDESVSYFRAMHRMGDINYGDSGGFTGLRFAPGTTDLRGFIDGTLAASLETSGTWTDEVT